MKAAVVLSPSTAKRLIAQGVAAHPRVLRAVHAGTVVVTLGTTNAYVASELLGAPVDHGAFVAGLIDRRWNVNARLGEASDLVLHRGKPVPFNENSTVDALGAGDVLIKGGNAIDPSGTVGVLMASDTGGTVGRYLPAALARGVELVLPISVAKSIHTPIDVLSATMGTQRIDQAMGLPCGMFPLFGHVVTEIEALALLFDVHATHVCSSGTGEGAGSVSLLIEGDEPSVQRAFTSIGKWSELREEPVRGRP